MKQLSVPFLAWFVNAANEALLVWITHLSATAQHIGQTADEAQPIRATACLFNDPVTRLENIGYSPAIRQANTWYCDSLQLTTMPDECRQLLGWSADASPLARMPQRELAHAGATPAGAAHVETTGSGGLGDSGSASWGNNPGYAGSTLEVPQGNYQVGQQIGGTPTGSSNAGGLSELHDNGPPRDNAA